MPLYLASNLPTDIRSVLSNSCENCGSLTRKFALLTYSLLKPVKAAYWVVIFSNSSSVKSDPFIKAEAYSPEAKLLAFSANRAISVGLSTILSWYQAETA